MQHSPSDFGSRSGLPRSAPSASTRWRDFADLFMLVPGDLVESEVIDAFRAVAEHRGMPLRPLGAVLEGMRQETQAHWATWRERQAAQDRVPEDFATVLDALDERTHALVLEGDRVARLLSPRPYSVDLSQVTQQWPLAGRCR